MYKIKQQNQYLELGLRSFSSSSVVFNVSVPPCVHMVALSYHICSIVPYHDCPV